MPYKLVNEDHLDYMMNAEHALMILSHDGRVLGASFYGKAPSPGDVIEFHKRLLMVPFFVENREWVIAVCPPEDLEKLKKDTQARADEEDLVGAFANELDSVPEKIAKAVKPNRIVH